MSKETIFCGDVHAGIKNDSIDFMDYQLSFFEKVMIPYCIDNGIKRVVYVGDFFDKRKTTNTMTAHMFRTRVIERLSELGISIIILIGNHDIYYRDSLEISTPVEFFEGRYKNVYIIKEFATAKIGQMKVDIIPWICKDNYTEVMQRISESQSQIALGHFELTGFKFAKNGQPCEHGLSPKVLKNYRKIYSGHFHGASESGNIKYLGTPYQLTWSDYDDPKGFYVFDDETGDVEFVKNDIEMFHVVEYDDEANKYTKLIIADFEKYSKKVVKLIVKKRKSKAKFDRFRDMFYQVGVLDLNIIEQDEQAYEANTLLTVAEAENTEQLIEDSVNQLQSSTVDSTKLKSLMADIHNRAIERRSTI